MLLKSIGSVNKKDHPSTAPKQHIIGFMAHRIGRLNQLRTSGTNQFDLLIRRISTRWSTPFDLSWPKRSRKRSATPWSSWNSPWSKPGRNSAQNWPWESSTSSRNVFRLTLTERQAISNNRLDIIVLEYFTGILSIKTLNFVSCCLGYSSFSVLQNFWDTCTPNVFKIYEYMWERLPRVFDRLPVVNSPLGHLLQETQWTGR